MDDEDEIVADDKTAIEIVQTIRDFTGHRNKQIIKRTDLGSDLGVAGQDGFDLLEKLKSKFNLIYSEDSMADYFGDEGIGLFSILLHLFKAKSNSTDVRNLEYTETRLEVGDIIEAIKSGTVLIPKVVTLPFKLKPKS